jgi:serine-type D-Ala-D-Ala carboxypeptidase/endopeptidase (penicillin-binding protein 4)
MAYTGKIKKRRLGKVLVKKRVLFLFMILFFSLEFSVKATENQGVLGNVLDQLLINEPDLNGAIAGVSIRSASNGQIIYDHLGDIRLRPASNMKLLTAASALSILGETYTFQTEILTDGVIKKNTLRGDLYLKGKGDPSLSKEVFNKMAEEIKKKGIKRINGDVIGDDTWYDNIRYSVDLPWSDETAYYGAQISALTASPNKELDTGTVVIEIKSGKEIGKKAQIKMIPKNSYVKIVNHTTMVSPKHKKVIEIERKHAKNIITINGTIPLHARKMKEEVAVWEPTRYALNLFNQALIDHGIKINRKIKTGITPETAQLLLTHQSEPLSRLLIPFMKLSNNGHAEILVKEIGKVAEGEGSWKKGLEVQKNVIAKYGANPKIMVLRDGSGISHVDLIPANQITSFLFSIQKEKWFPYYLNALPIGGKREKLVGGSLRKRFKNPIIQGKVKAKTGTISTVSALSGYVETQSGQKLIFSILLNNLLDESKGKKIEDKIVTLLQNQ